MIDDFELLYTFLDALRHELHNIGLHAIINHDEYTKRALDRSYKLIDALEADLDDSGYTEQDIQD